MFSISDQQKTGLLITVFTGVVLMILLAYFHFMICRGWISDYSTQVGNMNGRMGKLEAQLRQIDNTISQEAELKKQNEAIQKVTRRLPSSPDAPGFLTALVTILGRTGIIQEEVKPYVAVDRSLYTEIPYKIKANGHYHAFGQFLTLIEQNPDRFMRVRTLKLTNNIDRPSIHPIEMEITTFMFNK